MVEWLLEIQQSDGLPDSLYFAAPGASYIWSHGTNEAHPSVYGRALTTKVALTLTQANVLSPGLDAANMPVYYQEIAPAAVDQEVKIEFYSDGNVTDPVIDQECKIEFYSDGNVTDPNQEVKIEFYSDGNVTDPPTTPQEVKIEFYPDGNVTDVSIPESSYKWWLGKSYGRKGKYGRKQIHRYRL